MFNIARGKHTAIRFVSLYTMTRHLFQKQCPGRSTRWMFLFGNMFKEWGL